MLCPLGAIWFAPTADDDLGNPNYLGALEMLDINFIRENAEKVQKGAQDKCFDVDIPRLLELDDQRRALIQENESVRARRNAVAADIPKASNEARPALVAEGRERKDRLQE